MTLDISEDCSRFSVPHDAVYIGNGIIVARSDFEKRCGKGSYFKLPSLDGMIFRPHQPAGVMTDELGRKVLNIGVDGIITNILHRKEGLAEKYLERIFADRQDATAAVDWCRDFLAHIVNRTLPPDDRPDLQGALQHDYVINSDLYRALGLPMLSSPSAKKDHE